MYTRVLRVAGLPVRVASTRICRAGAGTRRDTNAGRARVELGAGRTQYEKIPCAD